MKLKLLFFLVSFSYFAQSGNVPANGLLAYYPFTGNANDASINANNGTATDVASTSDRFGNSNSAYYFNGTSSNIEANVANYPLKGESRTITGWFKATAPLVSQEYDFCLLNYGNISDPNYWFKISFYRKGYLDIQFDAKTVSSQENYFNNKWTFFALTFDSATKTYSLFINNVFKMDGTASLYTNGFGNLFRIGRNKLNNYFEGSIDDIGVWNRVLTPEELNGLYNSKSTYTLIPDLNFEKKLIALGIDSGTVDGKVLTSNISSLTSLDVSNSQIADLTGIQDFAALQTLSCNGSGNSWSSITGGDGNLKTLDISKNTKLITLNIYSNQLNSLDVSSNSLLKNLNCGRNILTSLNLSKNTALTSFTCNWNKLTSLDLSKNTALTSLICSSNQISSLIFSTNTTLTDIDCIGNKLTSLDVSKNMALSSLNCSSNQLASLEISNNLALTELVCSFNPLISLNLLKNEALTSLQCSNNKLAILDVSGNLALTNLICTSNQLTSLDFSKNLALNGLNCSSNQLTSLDLSKNVDLISLYCYSNQLTSLDLSKSVDLISLYCYSNRLQSLDLSKNITLIHLDCNSNYLKSLNLSNGNNAILYGKTNLTNNPNLTCIQVDNVAYSNANWGGFKDATASYSTSCPTLGIAEIIFDKISIYPNPVKGQLHIENIVLEKATVYDSLGKLIKITKFTKASDSNTLDLVGLTKGIYFINLQSEDMNIVRKVIVE